MQEQNSTKGKHLTYPERRLIERWFNQDHLSRRSIAERLGKAPQTINNEIKRGFVDLSFHGGGIEYSADIAQHNYEFLRGAVGATDTWTPEKAESIRESVLNKISPEIISQQADMPCHTTIYTWIYKGWIPGISRKDLLYPRKEKKPSHPRWKRPRKNDLLSIEDRPESINHRQEVGHFEIDLVILNKNKGEQLLTLTDRKTRYEIIRLIPDKRIKSVNHALTLLQKEYRFQSVTADNGSEFMGLTDVLDCPIYYAHPYASYERGSNENANRLIRRWLPKGTKTATPEEVAAIESWINHYPRKMFDFQCSAQLDEVANLLL